MREGFIGLGHAVYIFLLLNSGTFAIGRVEQFVRELVDHALFATAPAVLQDPADRQRRAAVGIALDRNLVVRAADAARLNFPHRLGVLHRLLQHLRWLVPAPRLQLPRWLVADG